jgi:hypothetical protein
MTIRPTGMAQEFLPTNETNNASHLQDPEKPRTQATTLATTQGKHVRFVFGSKMSTSRPPRQSNSTRRLLQRQQQEGRGAGSAKGGNGAQLTRHHAGICVDGDAHAARHAASSVACDGLGKLYPRERCSLHRGLHQPVSTDTGSRVCVQGDRK